MNIDSILKEMKLAMNKAIDYALHEFSTLHTGKASPTMVESIHVDSYGSKMRLKDIAAVTTPDSRTIRIEAWDKGVVQSIVKAIQEANLGFNPSQDGGVVRITIPELSRERRNDLVKVLNRMAEDGKIAIRDVRRKANEQLKKSEKEGHISKDDVARAEKDVQKETDRATAEIDKHVAHKEAELKKV